MSLLCYDHLDSYRHVERWLLLGRGLGDIVKAHSRVSNPGFDDVHLILRHNTQPKPRKQDTCQHHSTNGHLMLRGEST